ncbi:DUF1015 domain-containing protein [[Clostridium] leptum]|nr:DUF1015 domain-containing protein [[Clostridium] leptum]
MADIKAFRALRFDCQKAGDIAELTCPPYDIISEQQRLEYIEKNEHNVIRLELPREGEDPYAQAGRLEQQWEEEGILKRDEQECTYIYEEEFTVKGITRSIKGIVCLVKLTPFSEGVVLPHEFTLSKAKEDRFNLMKSTFCNFSQIYSLYMDDGNTRPLIEEASSGLPDQEFCDQSGVIHRLWAVADPDLAQKLSEQFKSRKLYIADGHHRYETALNFRDYAREQGLAKEGDPVDYCMMMLVDMEHPGLVVFPTHRVVTGLENFDPANALGKCSEYFELKPMDSIDNMEQVLEGLYEEGKTAFGLYMGGKGWQCLTLRDQGVMDRLLPDLSPASRHLDVTVLHTLILERLFGIDKENMANQKNLVYVKQMEEAIDAVRNGGANFAFLLNPTRVTEIRDVAAAGEKMPQKSTYFYPKLITGLVMNKLK